MLIASTTRSASGRASLKVSTTGVMYRRPTAPFVVLLSQDGANEAAHGRPVREDAHHIGASPDLLVETLLWVVGPDLLPVGEWEVGEGQDVGSGLVQ